MEYKSLSRYQQRDQGLFESTRAKPADGSAAAAAAADETAAEPADGSECNDDWGDG